MNLCWTQAMYFRLGRAGARKASIILPTDRLNTARLSRETHAGAFMLMLVMRNL